MKRLLPLFTLALGLAAGTGLGWFLSDRRSQPVIARLTQQVASVASAAGTSAPKPPKPTAATAAQPAEAGAVVTTTAAPDMEKMLPLMEKKTQEKRQKKIDERLAALKTRLGLTDAQVEALRPQLEKLVPDFSQWAKAALGGAQDGGFNESDMLKMMTAAKNWVGDADLAKAVDATLAPAQKQAFEAFRQEQRANDVEIAANRELSRLQGLMTLTAEQKDRLFKTLSDAALADLDKPVEVTHYEPEGLKKRADERAKLFEGILTPEQLAVYRGAPIDVMEMAAPFMDAMSFDVSDVMGTEVNVDVPLESGDAPASQPVR